MLQLRAKRINHYQKFNKIKALRLLPGSFVFSVDLITSEIKTHLDYHCKIRLMV